jgi:hypothetical protein
MNAYKFFESGRVAPFSHLVWPLDEWVQIEGPVEACRRGVHACRAGDLSYWIADELWVVELGGEVVHDERKLVAERGRLVRPVATWDDDARREYAGACARRVAHHAADELREAGLDEVAEALQSAELAAIPDAAAAAADAAYEAGRPNAAVLAELASDAARSVGAVPPAMVGYIAAHAADSRRPAGEEDPFAAERDVQASWLVDRLGLSASGA